MFKPFVSRATSIRAACVVIDEKVGKRDKRNLGRDWKLLGNRTVHLLLGGCDVVFGTGYECVSQRVHKISAFCHECM